MKVRINGQESRIEGSKLFILVEGTGMDSPRNGVGYFETIFAGLVVLIVQSQWCW